MPEYLHPGVYIEETSTKKPIEGVGTSVAGFIGLAPTGPFNVSKSVTSISEFLDVFGESEEMLYLQYAVHCFFEQGGERCYVVRSSGDDARAINLALHSFDEVRDVNLLAIPDAQGREIVTQLAEYCERRRDCFFIADPPKECRLKGKGEASLLDFKANLHSSFGALYYPWIQITNPSSGNKTLITVPPSGAVAGLYSLNDADLGIHTSPAGQRTGTLAIADDVEELLNEKDFDFLTNVGINPIRKFSDNGVIVWGGRTMAASTEQEFKYVSVRRLTIFIEESIKRGLQWVVFEPAGQTLWQQVKMIVATFLMMLWRNGALQGSKPEEAFFVKVDEENNPEYLIQEGALVMLIGIAAIKPAAFIQIKIEIKGGKK